MWKSIVAVVVTTVTGGAQKTTTVHALVTVIICQAGGPVKITPETLCNKCGRCCYFKVRKANGELWFTNEHCQFLDPSSKLCRVYYMRHKLDIPWCVDPLGDLTNDPCLPTDCPLAQVYGPPGYVGPKEKP